MDTLAHGLWTYALSRTRQRSPWKLLVFFGILPDLLWLPTILLGRLGFNNTLFIILYNISHSLVVWILVTLIISAVRGRFFWATWPWALHILIDIPGHPDFHTPFLWPVSSWTIAGWWDWLTPVLLVGNYLGLGAVFILFYVKGRVQKQGRTAP